MKNPLTWPVVILVVAAITAVVLLVVVIPGGDPREASAGQLVTTLTTLIGLALGISRIENVKQATDAVREQVNGRMSELIGKIPAPTVDGAIIEGGPAADGVDTPGTGDGQSPVDAGGGV